ncbi:histidine kinase dimerization/phosphoacceptor domain-containing protein [Actinoplanes sp. NPDC049265]|uniref:histidine kinase dimerization/phosphoacceptor domain-containing protein n=1 Tax=Actinoplanes sp. NPDC049265 TaxID=3363902 RepID=UPI003710EA34
MDRPRGGRGDPRRDGQRISEERLRIAREPHDVVAHHLTVANAQAGTAGHLLAKRPVQA